MDLRTSRPLEVVYEGSNANGIHAPQVDWLSTGQSTRPEETHVYDLPSAPGCHGRRNLRPQDQRRFPKIR